MDTDDGSPFTPWPLAWHPRADGDRPDPARFATPACAGDGFRPSGGLWTSPMLGKRHSVWSIYHDREELSAHHVRQGWALAWPDQDRTAFIDTEADLQRLVEQYPCRAHRVIQHAICAGFPIFHNDNATAAHDSLQWPPLDYAAMTADFDAIYLTEDGRQATWFKDPGTSAFSVSTVLWLRPAWTVLHPITTAEFDVATFADDMDLELFGGSPA